MNIKFFFPLVLKKQQKQETIKYYFNLAILSLKYVSELELYNISLSYCYCDMNMCNINIAKATVQTKHTNTLYASSSQSQLVQPANKGGVGFVDSLVSFWGFCLVVSISRF